MFPFVIIDSTFRIENGEKKLQFGEGNVEIYFCKNDKVLEVVPFRGSLPIRKHTRKGRIILRPRECLNGRLNLCCFGKYEKDSLYTLQIKYNTLFQEVGNVPIWRGKVMSNKYNLQYKKP